MSSLHPFETRVVPGDTHGSAISTAELHGRLADPWVTIVDARTTAAFNGWRLRGEARGGHIPGAVAFPVAWLTSVDDAEILRLLHAKRIESGRTVVVYGDGPDDARALQAGLAAFGIEPVHVYEGGFASWAAGETLPVERLAHHDRLVHIEWLRSVLDGDRPEAAPEGGLVLFPVNSGVP